MSPKQGGLPTKLPLKVMHPNNLHEARNTCTPRYRYLIGSKNCIFITIFTIMFPIYSFNIALLLKFCYLMCEGLEYLFK